MRPLVLLDGDDAGRTRRDALIKELYAGHLNAILMLGEALNRPGAETEIEDILGEAIVLPSVNVVLGQELALSPDDRIAGSLPSQIKASAKRQNITLPEGWKASASVHLVSTWAEHATTLSDDILNRAALLFEKVQERFTAMNH